MNMSNYYLRRARECRSMMWLYYVQSALFAASTVAYSKVALDKPMIWVLSALCATLALGSIYLAHGEAAGARTFKARAAEEAAWEHPAGRGIL